MSSLFLGIFFLRILDGGTVALGMSPCAPEFADVARFVEGPLYLTTRSTLLAATQTPLAIAQTGKHKPNA